MDTIEVVPDGKILVLQCWDGIDGVEFYLIYDSEKRGILSGRFGKRTWLSEGESVVIKQVPDSNEEIDDFDGADDYHDKFGLVFYSVTNNAGKAVKTLIPREQGETAIYSSQNEESR